MNKYEVSLHFCVRKFSTSVAGAVVVENVNLLMLLTAWWKLNETTNTLLTSITKVGEITAVAHNYFHRGAIATLAVSAVAIAWVGGCCLKLIIAVK